MSDSDSDFLPCFRFCAGVLLRLLVTARVWVFGDYLFFNLPGISCLSHPQIRVLKKCPELVEDFIERVVVLLVERSHGVVLCGVQVCVPYVG